MSDTFEFLQNHPFVFGLIVGLLAAFVLWVRALLERRELQREIRRLKELLHTKLEVEARSHRALHEELEQLRKQNENLRVTVQSLQRKPDRAELRTLHVYDAALRMLLSRSPGFGPAWTTVLEEAEAQVAQGETGLAAFVRRVFAPRSHALPPVAEPVDEEPPPDS